MTRQLCKIHPDWNYKTALGCPECVAELRFENKKLKEMLARIHQAATMSSTASPVNRDWLIENAKKLL